jgi:hypothetical protein
MSLIRQQIPSPNHSGTRSRSQLIVIHTSEGSTSQVGLGQYCQRTDITNRVSYHTCFDNNPPDNTIVEMLNRQMVPWAAMSANYWGVHGCCCTPSGASANWTMNDWYARPIMLEKCAAWIAEEAAFYRIPLTKINANDIQQGRSGVCGHGDCSAAGAGGSHFDPGSNFPFSYVLTLAAGGSQVPGPSGPWPVYPRRFRSYAG